MSLAEQYVQGVHRELKYWATWHPAMQLRVGDWGLIEDGILDRQGNVLQDWGIEYREDTTDVTGNWTFKTDLHAEIKVEAKGEVKTIPNVPKGKAGLQIKFKDDEAVVLVARGGKQHRIPDVHRLKRQLVAKARELGRDEFPRNIAIVTEVIVADITTVIVSNASDAEYAVSADADFGAGLLDLANAEIGVQFAHSRNAQAELDASKGATPLFRGFRVKRDFWDHISAQPLEALQEQPEDELPFSDDLAGSD